MKNGDTFTLCCVVLCCVVCVFAHSVAKKLNESKNNGPQIRFIQFKLQSIKQPCLPLCSPGT